MDTVRWLLAWLAGVVVVTVLGSMIQTQINLARIAALDEPVPFGPRIETTLFDLASFAPTWGVIMALGMLIATVVAGLFSRRWPRWRSGLFVFAGFVAVAAALGVMNAMLPVTAVAAARSASGFMLLCLAGALGGWVHARLSSAGPTTG